MAKPEWGSKRTCPECSTRFYDLGKHQPVTCISCAHTWVPESLLKSKQQHVAVAPKPKPVEKTVGDEVEAEDKDADSKLHVKDADSKIDVDDKADDKLVPDSNKEDDVDLAAVKNKKADKG